MTQLIPKVYRSSTTRRKWRRLTTVDLEESTSYFEACYENKIYVALINETFLRPSDNIKIPFYHSCKRDEHKPYRWLAIFVHKRVIYQPLPLLHTSSMQTLGIKILVTGSHLQTSNWTHTSRGYPGYFWFFCSHNRSLWLECSTHSMKLSHVHSSRKIQYLT